MKQIVSPANDKFKSNNRWLTCLQLFVKTRQSKLFSTRVFISSKMLKNLQANSCVFEVWRVEEKWRPSAKLQKRRANIEKCRHLQWTRRPVHLGSLLRPWTVPATISFVKKQNHVLRHFVRHNETWRWLAKTGPISGENVERVCYLQ